MRPEDEKLSSEMQEFIKKDVVERFLRYVQVHTTSDPESKTAPSSARQMVLLEMLRDELVSLGISDLELASNGYLYANIPGGFGEPFGLLAHVDSSPDQPGEGVKPRVVANWNGEPIHYPDNPELVLDEKLSPELKKFVGDSIITGSGQTLLGADDKAGVAEIMSAVATFQKFPQLAHGPLSICFTTDEEIGRGVDGVDLKRLPKYCYTMDGGEPGELEDECFDALRVELKFEGVGVHPGYAKGKMVNASLLAARFLAALPHEETPENTEGRQGFYYLTDLKGDHENVTASILLRDFDESINQGRIQNIDCLKAEFLQKYPGLKIEVTVSQQYRNMKAYIAPALFVVERAERAINRTGLQVIKKAIRGGTDGSRLSERGIPCPNIFAGGLLFHSKCEWIASSALCHGVETIIYLAREWINR